MRAADPDLVPSPCLREGSQNGVQCDDRHPRGPEGRSTPTSPSTPPPVSPVSNRSANRSRTRNAVPAPTGNSTATPSSTTSYPSAANTGSNGRDVRCPLAQTVNRHTATATADPAGIAGDDRVHPATDHGSDRNQDKHDRDGGLRHELHRHHHRQAGDHRAGGTTRPARGEPLQRQHQDPPDART